MSTKRELDEAEDGEISEPDPKRAKTKSSKTRQHQNSGIDPTWGQKYVFSDLAHASTIPLGEEDEFEDDSDAMAYLMSVRQEAGAIPHLLVAPKVHIGPQLPKELKDQVQSDNDDDDEGEVEHDHFPSAADSRGYYEDGAYIGITPGWDGIKCMEEGGLGEEDSESCEPSLEEAYLAAVKTRYHTLRTKLHSKVPPNAASRLSNSQVTHAAPFGRHSSTTKLWSAIVRNNDPNPIQVALMSKDSVLRVLRVILGGKFLQTGHPIPERMSQWLWALLARLPDQGELNHTEIGWIRDLGRRAVLLGRSLAEMAALRESLSEGDFGANEAMDASSSDEEDVAEFLADGEEGDEQNSSDTPCTENEIQGPPDFPPNTDPPDIEYEHNKPEEGEVSENEEDNSEGEIAMDLASDSDSEEGEVTEQANEVATDLEDAKRRLLARLADAEDEQDQEGDEEAAHREAEQRARINMRATINMILTVAGEYYGQRDLLAFREPFIRIDP